MAVLKGITLSAPTPGLASLNIKPNYSREVPLQIGEATLSPSILPPFQFVVSSPLFTWAVLISVGIIQVETYLITLPAVFAVLLS